MKRQWLAICLMVATIFASCKGRGNEPEPVVPPTDSVPTDTVPVVPTDTVPTDTIPADTVSVDTVYVEVVPDPIELHCVQPPFLKQGDTIAIISPSYYTPLSTINSACDVLRGWGLVPYVATNVGQVYAGKYAGTVEQRLADLHEVFTNPNVKAVLCSRGGYGTIQLIPEIDLQELAEHPKWLIGYSDISTLHGLMSRAGVMSIHGTMATFLPSGSNGVNCTMIRDLLLGVVPTYNVPAHAQNIIGTASGILVGGNICTFAPNLGTQADATLGQDLILFIEEVGESMHNVDRQFNMLRLNGVLERCKGVVLGEFSGCGSEFSYSSIEEMLRQYIEPYGIPLLCGFPAGHGSTNLPLVMGAPTTIEVRSDGATIRFDITGLHRSVNTATVSAPVRPLEERMRMAGKIE